MRRIYRTLAVLSLTVSLATIPMTAYASQWQQDSTGWKVQADDGTYLMNQWYQNTDGKWYYIGADGYMMVNTVTPDGYQVDNNGVWIQPTVTNPVQQPEVQPTQSQDQQLAPGALSIEEIERRKAEAGLGQEGNGKGETVKEIHGDADAGQGYNWQ